MAKIVVTCPEARGHINGSTSLATELKARGHEVVFLGRLDGKEPVEAQENRVSIGCQANLIAVLWFSISGRPLLARKPRVHFGGALYHVMSRGNQGQSILKDDGDGGRYLDCLKESQKRFCVTTRVISWS